MSTEPNIQVEWDAEPESENPGWLYRNLVFDGEDFVGWAFTSLGERATNMELLIAVNEHEQLMGRPVVTIEEVAVYQLF